MQRKEERAIKNCCKAIKVYIIFLFVGGGVGYKSATFEY